MSECDGGVIVRVNVLATAWFVLTATAATIVFDGPVLWIAGFTAVSMFLAGLVTFLWAFLAAVGRSRTESIAVTQLFLLLGGVAPRRVTWVMLSLLGAQSGVGLATAILRADAGDGTPGSPLALGVLVPMFGLGLNGLWGAYHGSFGVRHDTVSTGSQDPASDRPE